jgi:hypothetical protein
MAWPGGVLNPLLVDPASTHPVDPTVRDLVNEITDSRDQHYPSFPKHLVDRICSLTQADGVARWRSAIRKASFAEPASAIPLT